MPNVWDAATRERLLRRLEGLTPESRPQWGRFSSAHMLHHCAAAMKAGLGELPVKAKISPLRWFPLKQLIVHVLPFPKNAPTAPELLAATAPSFADAKTDFLKTFERFTAAGPKHRFADHAAFGTLTGDEWGLLQWRHIDHHWRQFGL